MKSIYLLCLYAAKKKTSRTFRKENDNKEDNVLQGSFHKIPKQFLYSAIILIFENLSRARRLTKIIK